MLFVILVHNVGGSNDDLGPRTAWDRYANELADAGVLLDLAWLEPRRQGASLKRSGNRVDVAYGADDPVQASILGYWVIQANSLPEAVGWAKRLPWGSRAPASQQWEVEIRQVHELGGSSPDMTDRPVASEVAPFWQHQTQRMTK